MIYSSTYIMSRKNMNNASIISSKVSIKTIYFTFLANLITSKRRIILKFTPSNAEGGGRVQVLFI